MSNYLSRTDRIKVWWNKAVTVRVKALIYTFVVLVMIITSFQVQNYLIDARARDRACVNRIEARDSLRNILFYVVDLSDVLPGSKGAESYTKNRIDFINSTYPEIDESNC